MGRLSLNWVPGHHSSPTGIAGTHHDLLLLRAGGATQLCAHSFPPIAGTHHDLLLLPGGRYAALWAKQQASGEEHSELPIAS